MVDGRLASVGALSADAGRGGSWNHPPRLAQPPQVFVQVECASVYTERVHRHSFSTCRADEAFPGPKEQQPPWGSVLGPCVLEQTILSVCVNSLQDLHQDSLLGGLQVPGY